LNAGVGWYQEKQAGDIVAQLKAGIALKAIVVRNGKEIEVDARDIVPGDVLVLEEGSTIPADAKVGFSSSCISLSLLTPSLS
jgi:H+-transporting ATPase